MRLRLALLALPFCVLLALAGCGGSEREGAEALSKQIPQGVLADSPPYGTCTVGATSADVRMTIEAYGADAACDDVIRAFAEQGDYWRTLPVSASLAIVCELTEPNGAGSVIVRDSGSAYHGQRLCANYVAAGWIDLAR